MASEATVFYLMRLATLRLHRSPRYRLFNATSRHANCNMAIPALTHHDVRAFWFKGSELGKGLARASKLSLQVSSVSAWLLDRFGIGHEVNIRQEPPNSKPQLLPKPNPPNSRKMQLQHPSPKQAGPAVKSCLKACWDLQLYSPTNLASRLRKCSSYETITSSLWGSGQGFRPSVQSSAESKAIHDSRAISVGEAVLLVELPVGDHQVAQKMD